MRNTVDVTGGKSIAVRLQSLGVCVNPLVAFYDVHGSSDVILLFCLGDHTIKISLSKYHDDIKYITLLLTRSIYQLKYRMIGHKT
jgi:hypothetical protein